MTQPSEESVPPYTPEEQQHIGHIPDVSKTGIRMLHETTDPAVLAAMEVLGERALKGPNVEVITRYPQEPLE